MLQKFVKCVAMSKKEKGVIMAKEHLPTAEFKGLSKKLNEIQPLKEIIKPLKVLNKVKDVIEKSLF